MTLAGASIAVASSSIFYVNFLLRVVMPDTFLPNPWLNPMVFMVNVQSVLNGLGIAMVSGLLASVSFQKLKQNMDRVSPGSSAHNSASTGGAVQLLFHSWK